MRHRIAPIVLGAVFVAAFFTSAFLLSLHWSSAGLVTDAPVDTTTCDSVISVLIEGAHEYAPVGDGVGQVDADEDFARWCAQGSLAPGSAGLAVAAVGLIAGVVGVVLFVRGRRGVPVGEPISRRRRLPED